MWTRVALVFVLGLTACASEGESGVIAAPTAAVTTSSDGCADVTGVTVRSDGDGFSFDVTVRSADEGWDKYADAWEVRGLDGAVLGVRELLHPHETEQPFTRSLAGVEVPTGETSVVVAARDSVLGFCGETLVATLPGRP